MPFHAVSASVASVEICSSVSAITFIGSSTRTVSYHYRILLRLLVNINCTSRLQDEDLVQLIGVVVCLLAALQVHLH